MEKLKTRTRGVLTTERKRIMTFDKILPHLLRGRIAVNGGRKFWIEESNIYSGNIESTERARIDANSGWFAWAIGSPYWEIHFDYASSGKDALFAILMQNKNAKFKENGMTYKKSQKEGWISMFTEYGTMKNNACIHVFFDAFSTETNWEILHD